jgi:glycosyltransferase involved in cell wall biosynthesis
MKILMLTPYLPYPPSSGGQVRSYNLIKNISKKHEITLFSLVKSDEEKKYIPELEKFCQKVEVFKRPDKPFTLKNIFKTGFGLYPLLVVRNWSSLEKEAVSRELATGSYQLIHAETFYIMPHIPKTSVPILLVDQTIEFQVYQHVANTSKFWLLRPLLYYDVLKIRFWETRFWQKAAKVVAVSESDKKKMLKLVPSLSVEVVPNGVGEDLINLWPKRKKSGKPVVFFQGNFSWLQNTEAAKYLIDKVFPLIKTKIGDVSCLVAGQGAREKIGFLARGDIEIRDIANSDIEGVKKAYQEASVFLAPIFGPGGTRLKILGAMASGLPVVTTAIGIEGIDANNGQEVLVRNKPEEMADAVVSLLKDQILFKRITKAARQLIEKNYSWPKIADKLDKIYQEVGNYGKKG